MKGGRERHLREPQHQPGWRRSSEQTPKRAIGSRGFTYLGAQLTTLSSHCGLMSFLHVTASGH